MKVKVYDRFRFAIPVFGEVVKIGTRTDGGEGVKVRLTTSNNFKYPIGSTIWVHRRQCRAVLSKKLGAST